MVNSGTTNTIKNVIIVVLLAISICLIIFSVAYIKNIKPKIIIKEEKYEGGILDLETTGWYENEYNSNEMFFSYFVYNYGNSETKNVDIRCKLYDEEENLLVSTLNNFGSVASHSAKYGDSITKNIPTNPDAYYVYFCYVESCDNCKILYKEIPELVEFYEKE